MPEGENVAPWWVCACGEARAERSGTGELTIHGALCLGQPTLPGGVSLVCKTCKERKQVGWFIRYPWRDYSQGPNATSSRRVSKPVKPRAKRRPKKKDDEEITWNFI